MERQGYPAVTMQVGHLRHRLLAIVVALYSFVAIGV
jgi:hypothetical protein